MRVTAYQAVQVGGGDAELRVFSRLPRAASWQLRALDVECPACRRRAVHVRLDESRADPSYVVSAMPDGVDMPRQSVASV